MDLQIIRPVVEQLLLIRQIQCQRLYDKLPSTFLTRSKQFTEFVSTLETSFDISNTDLKEMTTAMKKIQSFDMPNSF